MVDAAEMGAGLKRKKSKGKRMIWLSAAGLLLLPNLASGFCHEMEVVGARVYRVAANLPGPALPKQNVPTSHQNGPHSNLWMAKGNPVILEGLPPGGENWRAVHMSIKDVSVYTVPAYHDKSQGLQRGKNAIFVFRVDDICIAHLGDLGHLLTPDQLKMLGKIDILLVPLAGGVYTITASEAREVTKQGNPKK